MNGNCSKKFEKNRFLEIKNKMIGKTNKKTTGLKQTTISALNLKHRRSHGSLLKPAKLLATTKGYEVIGDPNYVIK